MQANQTLDATFAALADPTRRAILRRLASGEATAGELARPFSISQPAVSQHLKVLEKAGLISRRQEAQRRYCRLEGESLGDAATWLDTCRKQWEAKFEKLDAVLDQMMSASK